MNRLNQRRGCSPVVWLLGLAALGLCVICAVVIALLLILRSDRNAPATNAIRSDPSTLVIAYSPEKADLFEQLIRSFNATRPKGMNGEALKVEAVVMDMEAMLTAAVEGDAFQAISPDSSLWFGPLDQLWSEKVGEDVPLVGATTRYAVTPIVIAAWEPVARSLGWPDRPVGWDAILDKASSDPDFKWNHPSAASASGLLATLAEFYAGVGKTRGLTKEDALAQSTLDYVAAIERTVRFYGEGELGIMAQVEQEGQRALDAFVVPEQLVIQYNQGKPAGRLVAIYPQEGTLWADHPLALLEKADLTANQRLAFQQFREFLLTDGAQSTVLQAGYRPADLRVSLSDPGSPFTSENGVDAAEPQTTLQIPSPEVVEVVRNVWWYTKRHTNVYLVVDTSGSMEGAKLEAAREALLIFLDQIKGDLERVGMVEFNTHVVNIIPLDELGNNRQTLQDEIEGLRAGGDTALLDGVAAAHARLQKENDAERINAIVALTDGRENASNISLSRLVDQIQSDSRSGVPVVVFTVAFGGDADMGTLRTLAESTGGQARQGDPETIRDLYKILSTYF